MTSMIRYYMHLSGSTLTSAGRKAWSIVRMPKVLSNSCRAVSPDRLISGLYKCPGLYRAPISFPYLSATFEQNLSWRA
jgi:hypothetical protein